MSYSAKLVAAASKDAVRSLLAPMVREVLLTKGPGTYSTVDLVEALWPPNTVLGEEAGRRRQEVFELLAEMARHELGDVAQRGPEKLNRFKRKIRPWVWSYVEKTCPHCGGKL